MSKVRSKKVTSNNETPAPKLAIAAPPWIGRETPTVHCENADGLLREAEDALKEIALAHALLDGNASYADGPCGDIAPVMRARLIDAIAMVWGDLRGARDELAAIKSDVETQAKAGAA